MNQFAAALCHAKTPNEFIVNGGVFRTLIRADKRLQRFQIRIKTLAIRIRYFFCFATLVIHLINIVPALFVQEGHLRVVRRRIQAIQHVRHGRNCGFILRRTWLGLHNWCCNCCNCITCAQCIYICFHPYPYPKKIKKNKKLNPILLTEPNRTESNAISMESTCCH